MASAPRALSGLVLGVGHDVVVRDDEDEDGDAQHVGEEPQVLVVDHLRGAAATPGGPPLTPRHAAPARRTADQAYFQHSQIACRDGSKTIPILRVNDDYCDCLDGTDEPGTSACPDGKFYCPNRAYVPRIIPSSQVNDGICDCCDGSDEWEGVVVCKNTCLEAGADSRKQLAGKVATYQAGVKARKQYVEQAEQLQNQWKTELEDLMESTPALKETVDTLKGSLLILSR
eukprot:SM000095S25009  [mRNA]  locus=s95:437787:439503:+ [translate_table: standard]